MSGTPRADEAAWLQRSIRVWLVIFIVGLVLSGVTAFPLTYEARWLVRLFDGALSPIGDHLPALVDWLRTVSTGLDDASVRYPFLAYGSDWLAFAHLVIAVAFWGPYRDPVRNIWVVQFGRIACVGVIPLALICGPIRGIPFFWQLIDMSFGLVGLIPLTIVHRRIQRLETLISL